MEIRWIESHEQWICIDKNICITYRLAWTVFFCWFIISFVAEQDTNRLKQLSQVYTAIICSIILAGCRTRNTKPIKKKKTLISNKTPNVINLCIQIFFKCIKNYDFFLLTNIIFATVKNFSKNMLDAMFTLVFTLLSRNILSNVISNNNNIIFVVIIISYILFIKCRLREQWRIDKTKLCNITRI